MHPRGSSWAQLPDTCVSHAWQMCVTCLTRVCSNCFRLGKWLVGAHEPSQQPISNFALAIAAIAGACSCNFLMRILTAWVLTTIAWEISPQPWLWAWAFAPIAPWCPMTSCPVMSLHFCLGCHSTLVSLPLGVLRPVIPIRSLCSCDLSVPHCYDICPSVLVPYLVRSSWLCIRNANQN